MGASPGPATGNDVRFLGLRHGNSIQSLPAQAPPSDAQRAALEAEVGASPERGLHLATVVVIRG